MQTNEIVTSFIKFRDKILILRRSEHVSTYKWCWGAVSGFVEKEEKPLDRAIAEIKEETGLSENEFELVKEGSSFTFDDNDEGVDIKWIVHPFLFSASKNKIKINKEHYQIKWIKPEELSKYFTVPRLDESLRRVLGASF